MKRVGVFIISLIFLSLTTCKREVSNSSSSPKGILLNIPVFAIGPVGEAASTSNGEKALVQLLSQPDPISNLKGILESGSLEGKLYALYGLQQIDREIFLKEAKGIKINPTEKVNTQQGCIGDSEEFSKVLKNIQVGYYEQWKKASPTK